MIRRHKDIELEGSPVFPARVSTEGIDTRIHLVEAAFITLRAGLAMFSDRNNVRVDADTPELSEIDFCLSGRRVRHIEVTRIMPASNGHALLKLTRGGLKDFSIRLKVPTDSSEPEFHKEAFNVDDQYLPPQPVNLTGIKEISKNPDAVVEILSFERDIVYASLTNWEGFQLSPVRTIPC